MTKDLRYARVYFSVLGEDSAKRLALKGLKHAKGHIKGLLSDRIKLKFMPEIEFKIDEAYEHSKKIFDLVDKIKKEKADGEGGLGDTEA